MIDERASTPGQGGPEPTRPQNGDPNRNAGPGAGSPTGGNAQQGLDQNARGDPAGSVDAQGPLEGGSGRIAELEAKLAALQDQYVRAVADTENVRRRSQEEIAKARKYGIEAFAESLLPVRDSLELALNADAPSVENMKEGVEVTLRQLAQAFEKNRLMQIDPAGEKFDPNLHQAISVVPGDAANPPVAPNHVVLVLQKGYLINDRVLRPALVTVAQA